MTDASPLVKRSLVDQALEQLRARINNGTWAVGQRLPTEPELAAQLNISRNTVREAMRVLAFAGLIEIRQGDGSYLRGRVDPMDTVRVLSSCSIAQIRETRRILEVEAVGLAAKRRTDEDLQLLRQALEASAEHYHGELDTFIRCDLLFHQCLIDAAHNPALSELYRYTSNLVSSQLRQTLDIHPRRQSVFDLHGALLDAVEQQDSQQAMALCRTLINEP
ncbi:DNA-binding transcriptional regulator, FadR family [Pseudomonas taetrolens]|uniref:DNA-binding transcriptional regulator, FadR family n=1 Tax=Pseudomonas taetrolens TaxID=47884 RepID=A0A0J6GU94_PSETA|nr:FadR/GntR family transcriptional regulator [Pseudomonas taetrolens]KMM85923.1 GntR family transcriptional regulator [Pseudomonas taetrolens]SED05899.1 DNA-binding transcriptional regulator, FadR family [Pseudomonas taetrolens]SQF87759.1 GntR family transcriptional regulator [Pseudomonas taetrolens]VEH50950.1 GntR family transcriptional regulator [Pseudomonas taetrolens]